MQAGATLGRRFTVLRTVDHDLPGVERWVAQDSRRYVDVTLDVLVSVAPGAVRRAAVRAAQVRDARFARVIASGRESVAGERITYVVTERPTGVSVAELAGHRIVPARQACALISEAARALSVAASQGIHHGHVRASVLTVTDAGRVVVAGLDSDGELATQAGVGRGRTELADAHSLGQLLLTLVTGAEATQVTVPDLPSDLPLGAADLARAAVAGESPATLAQVARALGPADPAALRELRRSWSSLPSIDEDVPAPAAPPPEVHVDPATLSAAEHEAAAALAAGIATPVVAQEVVAEHIDPEVIPHPADERAQYATPEQAAKFSKRTRRAVERTSHEPLALDTFEEINEDQNEGTSRSLWLATLEGIQRHVPQNAPLDTAVDWARQRSERSGPLRTGPLLVGLFLTAIVIVGAIAFAVLQSPLEGEDQIVDPTPDYPAFTFSPEPSASPSPDEGG